MELEFGIKDKALIVAIDGEIDHHTSIELREKIDREIDKSPIKDLIFDFHKVSFMDSSGVGMVIGRYKNIQKLGGKVSIIRLLPPMERVFEISGLFKLVPHYKNIDQALENM